MIDGGGRDGPTMNYCPLVRLENQEQFQPLDNSMINLVWQGDEVIAKSMTGVTLGALRPVDARKVIDQLTRISMPSMRAQFNMGTVEAGKPLAPFVSVDVVTYAARRGKPGYP